MQQTVFYGICSEGLGHFSRAATLIPALKKAGYSVEIFAGHKVANLCKERFPDCRINNIHGFRMKYRHNTLDLPVTLLNYTSMAFWSPIDFSLVTKRAFICKPIAVISDYEPVVSWFASTLKIPLITLDHQLATTQCKIDFDRRKKLPYQLLRASNRLTYLKPKLNIITSFYREPLVELSNRHIPVRKTIGPVLRPEVLQRKPSSGEHILVYQTSHSMDQLHSILNKLPGEKRVYGATINCESTTLRNYDESTFLDDLASCRFAIVNGGHTTITEALHYGKPVICFPVLGQAEQEINAHYVEKLGFGVNFGMVPYQTLDFRKFFQQESIFKRNIAEKREQCANNKLIAIVMQELQLVIKTKK